MGYGEKELSFTVCGIANWYRNYGNRCGGLPKTKNKSTIGPRSCTPWHVLKGLPIILQYTSHNSYSAEPGSLMLSLQWVGNGDILNVLSPINGQWKRGLYSPWNTIQPLETEIMNLAGKWLELVKIMLNELTQTQKEKHHKFSFIWDPLWNLQLWIYILE